MNEGDGFCYCSPHTVFVNTLHAIRWALYERFLSVLWLLVGLAIAAGSVWIGAGDVLLRAVYGESTVDAAQSLPLAGGGLLAGLVVWQLGSTAVSLKTISSVTATADDHQTEQLEASLTATIDDRFDALQAELSGGDHATGSPRSQESDEWGGGGTEESVKQGREQPDSRRAGGTTKVHPEPAADADETSSVTDPNAAFERE